MTWLYKCPKCEATSLDQIRTRCEKCFKDMVKSEKINDDYLGEMQHRNYWMKLKQIEWAYQNGRITDKQYSASRKMLEKIYPKASKGKNLIIAVEKPLAIPKDEDYRRKIF